MHEQILKSILENSIIIDYFNKVQEEYRDDFRQHIWLIITEMMADEEKSEKIEKLWKADNLGKFIVGIITNQLKSNTSSFTKLYKDSNIIYTTIPELKEEEVEQQNARLVILKMLNILNNIHFVDAVLFKLYYGIDPITNEITQPKTYGEIQNLIGINYQTVRNSVLKTKKTIKEHIKI